jgi:hypothetical protein
MSEPAWERSTKFMRVREERRRRQLPGATCARSVISWAASVGNRAPAVLRRREQRRSFLCERRRSRRIESARCASGSI